MNIKILGPGCPNCEALEKLVINALAEMDIAASLDKVKNMEDIMKYNVLMTPALVINEEVVCSGRLPQKEEIKKLVSKFINK